MVSIAVKAMEEVKVIADDINARVAQVDPQAAAIINMYNMAAASGGPLPNLSGSFDGSYSAPSIESTITFGVEDSSVNSSQSFPSSSSFPASSTLVPPPPMPAQTTAVPHAPSASGLPGMPGVMNPGFPGMPGMPPNMGAMPGYSMMPGMAVPHSAPVPPAPQVFVDCFFFLPP